MTAADHRDDPSDDDPRVDVPHAPGDDPIEHLWSAAHEMLQAFRTLIDAADEFVASQRGPRADPRRDEPRDGRVHHIDIDGRESDDAPTGDRPDAGPSPAHEAGSGMA